MTRYDIVNHFLKERNFNSFLEIGTYKGDCLKNIKAKIRMSVDPDPHSLASFIMPSDEFFSFIKEHKMNFFRYGVIFIDGLHTHDQAYRDICNATSLLLPNGVIVMHDCLPTSEKMQEYYDKSQQGLEWTGDVWKAFVKARSELPYLMYTINQDYGCGIIDTRYTRSQRHILLPTDMKSMTYDDFVKNRNEWMNIKETIINGDDDVENMTEYLNFIGHGMQQGWQCPVCKRVYSPITPMCYCCGNNDTIQTTMMSNTSISS